MRVILVALMVLCVALAGCSKGGSGPPTQQDPISLQDDPADPKAPQVGFQDEEEVESTTACDGRPTTGLDLTVREPGGLPLGKAHVAVLGTSAQNVTDPDGQVEFLNLTAGRHTLRITPEQEWYKLIEANLTVAADCLTTATVVVPLRDGFLTPPHAHGDAWRGRQEFELFSIELDKDCVVFGTNCINSQYELEGIAVPFPEVVPPGTGWVNATVSWSEPAAQQMCVDLRPPTGSPLSADVSPGDTVSMAIEDDQSDVAHASVSAWTAWLGCGTGGRPGVWLGPHIFTVTVARSDRPLTIDPPHPDYWEGNTTIRLADRTTSWTPATVYAGQYQLNRGSEFGFDEGKLVYPGTDIVRFEAWINHTVPHAPPMELRVWRERDSSNRADAYTADEEGGKYTWDVPVPEGWLDPVYESRSQWGFQLRPTQTHSLYYTAYDGGVTDLRVIATAHKQGSL